MTATGGTELPESIGPYRILRCVGHGGMATVYAAQQAQPRRTVAIKILRDLPEPDRALRRFRREIEILGKLRHQYIAQVFDAGMHEDGQRRVPYYVMEYVPGARTIVEFVDAHSLSLRKRLKLFINVCAAVEHGHQLRIIHRDLKPANILIDERGTPKVIDFGIAHRADFDDGNHGLTREHDLVGTMQYMAPEQVAKTPVDIDSRCDVYALGALLYRLATNRRHHDIGGLPIVQAARVIQESDPVAPSRLAPEVKGDLETIIMTALDRDAARRYRSAGRLGADILRHLRNEPIHARPVSRLHRARLFARRHRPAVIASSIAILILWAASILLVVQHLILTQQFATVGPDSSDSAATSTNTDPDAGSTDAAPVAAEPYRLAHDGPQASAITWSADGTRLAIASNDAMAIFDLEQRTRLAITRDHDAPIKAVHLSQDGTVAVSVAPDDTVMFILAQDGSVIRRARHRFGTPRATALHPEGRYLAMATDAFTVAFVAIDDTERSVLRSYRGTFDRLAISRDGTRLATATSDGVVSIWDPEQSTQLAEYTQLSQEIRHLTFTEEGALMAVDLDGNVAIWTDADTPGSRPIRRTISNSTAAIVNPLNGDYIERATAAWELIDPDGESVRWPVKVFATPGVTMLSPDSTWAAVARVDGSIEIEPIVRTGAASE